jgi:membrane protease YdiL (CAAX protease family)
MAEAPTRRRQPDAVVLLWVISLFAITGIGILPLFFYRLDLSKLTFASSVPVAVGIGIELTAFAPTLAALLVTGFLVRNRGIRKLLRPVIRWRVGIHWYLIALAGPTALFVVGDLVRLLAGAPLPTSWFVIPSAGAASFLVGALIAGSFGEEVGWRGFGQPRLQQQYGAFWAAVIVGSIWSLWHLWPAVAPGGIGMTTWSDVSLTFVRLISMSIIYAWLYNNTKGSLLIVMLAHAGHNIAVRIVPAADSVNHGDPVVASLYAVAAAAIVLMAGSQWLTRSHVFPDLARPQIARHIGGSPALPLS